LSQNKKESWRARPTRGVAASRKACKSAKALCRAHHSLFLN